MEIESQASNYVLDVYVKEIKCVAKSVNWGLEGEQIHIHFELLEQISSEIVCSTSPKSGSAIEDIPLKVLKGASCLFPLTKALMDRTKVFPLNIDVCVKTQNPPSKISIGTTNIDLSERFIALHKDVEAKPIQGIYPVRNTENNAVAILDMIVRVSKLDPVVKTEFTMGNDPGYFVLRGEDKSKSFLCRSTCNMGDHVTPASQDIKN